MGRNASEHKNYCRNPNGEFWPWCFTVDTNVPFHYCYIPLCREFVYTFAILEISRSYCNGTTYGRRGIKRHAQKLSFYHLCPATRDLKRSIDWHNVFVW